MGKIKRLDLDVNSSILQLTETPVKILFFCFRCDIRKQSRQRAFWKTTEGEKVICGSCYEDIKKKRDKLKKRGKFTHKKEEDDLEEHQRALCPFLLELDEEHFDYAANIPKLIELVTENLVVDNSDHYFSKCEKVFFHHGLSYNLKEVDPQKCPIDQLTPLVELLSKKVALFSNLQQSLIRKAHRIIFEIRDRQENSEKWVRLQTAADLPKLRAALEMHPEHFQTIVKTLDSKILEELDLLRRSQLESVKPNKSKSKTAVEEIPTKAKSAKHVSPVKNSSSNSKDDSDQLKSRYWEMLKTLMAKSKTGELSQQEDLLLRTFFQKACSKRYLKLLTKKQQKSLLTCVDK